MTHEVEGSHASISAQLARRYGESQHVVHAIEAHHYEVEPQTVEAVLLISADAISASRPGARGESLEHYIKRLESLEELAAQKPGVEKVYALQAGREIRVIVKPAEVDDDAAVLLSHEIAREIEDQLEYPGQVKVTVIRESRAIDVARNVANGGQHETLAPAEPVPQVQPDSGSPSAGPLGERRRRAERDEDDARAVADGVPPTPQQAADRSGRERVERVGDEPEPDEDEAEDERLRPDTAAVGIDELRQEGEEEERRLGIEDVHDHAAHECPPQRLTLALDRRLRSRSSSFRTPR